MTHMSHMTLMTLLFQHLQTNFICFPMNPYHSIHYWSQSLFKVLFYLQRWSEKLLAMEPYYEELGQYYLDLPKQITKKKTDEAVDCLMGTYRKLNID